MKLLIRKGRVVDPVGGIGGVMDILVEDGRVAVIGSELTAPSARVIDARGLTVCAGLVDMHVHLREPGFEYKETIQTGCLAAARGGVTSIAPMPNTRPATDCPERIALVRQKAAQACGVHVWPIGAVTWGQKGQVLTDAAALKKAGAVALSDDGMPVQNANLLRDALKRDKSITYNWHDPQTSYLEAIFSRGDRRLADVLEHAWQNGAKFDSWSEYFDFQRWMDALEACGLNGDFYAHRVREKDEVFPWSVPSVGVSRAFLWHERELCYQSVTTPDCRTRCSGCGANKMLEEGRTCG